MSARPATYRARVGAHKLAIVARSDTGRGRAGKPNEDSWAVVIPGLLHRDRVLLMIADGMGGHHGGSNASALVVKQARKVFLRSPRADTCNAVLHNLVRSAHQAVCQQAARDPALAKMGSTAVVALLSPRGSGLINVGDSRAYLLRGDTIARLTLDHSWVGERVRAGELTEAEARRHPERNRLTMSLSAARKTEDVTPYFVSYDPQEGDVLLLCSDGLWAVVSEGEIQAVVADLPPAEAVSKLVSLANASQGPDNITVLLAQVGNTQGIRPAEEPTRPGVR